MISQSFQDEYAEEASAERKALEQKMHEVEEDSKPKGDLGGTNGTNSITEKEIEEVALSIT